MTEYHQTAALALAKCAAYDAYFPKPNQPMVEAWAEAISEYQLSQADVLQGVKLAYRDNGSGFKPLPKDIIDRARSVRRERAERETDDQRQDREAAIDAKAEGRRKAINQFTQRFALERADS